MTMTVVVADDNLLIREGVRLLLANEAAVQVVAGCGDLPETIAAVDAHRPDIVLTDIRMPPHGRDEGIQIAEHCRTHHPDTGVVLLSQYADPNYIQLLLAHGTARRGYLLKERVAAVADLIASIRTVAAGGSAIDPKIVEVLVHAKTVAGDSRLAALTPRERDVLAGIAQGRTNAAIAAMLVLTQRAVEKHINAVFAKLSLTGDRDQHPRVRAALLYLAEQQPSEPRP